MSDLDYKLFRKTVKNVALQVTRSFGNSSLDSRDTEGHLWLWLYEKRESVRKLVEEDSQWEPQIASTLRKVASSYCAGEKAVTEGYDPRDTFIYSLQKVTSLLESVFEYEDWQSFAISMDPTPRAKRQVNESGDRNAELSDIKAALERLPDNHYNALLWTYKFHLTTEQLGVEMEVSTEAAKKRLQRAREALQRECGKKVQPEETGVTGRREVKSNAAWAAATSNQYS